MRQVEAACGTEPVGKVLGGHLSRWWLTRAIPVPRWSEPGQPGEQCEQCVVVGPVWEVVRDEGRIGVFKRPSLKFGVGARVDLRCRQVDMSQEVTDVDQVDARLDALPFWVAAFNRSWMPLCSEIYTLSTLLVFPAARRYPQEAHRKVSSTFTRIC